MMDKEEYKRELVRMWDSLRTEYVGRDSCIGVNCEKCPLHENGNHCGAGIKCAFETIATVEKWSKEHPPKKYKVSQVEYDILKSFKESNLYSKFYFMSSLVTRNLLKLGYFEGADERMKICDYLNDCEVCEVVEGD